MWKTNFDTLDKQEGKCNWHLVVICSEACIDPLSLFGHLLVLSPTKEAQGAEPKEAAQT